MARNIVADTRTSEPLLHVWGALKAHEKMQEFTELRFKDHSALTGIYTRFVMRRKTDLDGLVPITRKLTAMEVQVKAMERHIASLQAELKKKQDK
jgi:hypothetical protein